MKKLLNKKTLYTIGVVIVGIILFLNVNKKEVKKYFVKDGKVLK